MALCQTNFFFRNKLTKKMELNMIEQDMKHSENTSTARLDGDTPNLRLFALL